MLDDKRADVYMAAASNKKRKERLQLVLIIAVAFVFVVVWFFISPNFISNNKLVGEIYNSAEEIKNIQRNIPLEKNDQDLEKLIHSYKESIKPALKQLPRNTLYEEKGESLLKRLDKLVSESKKNTIARKNFKKELHQAEILLDSYQKEIKSALARLEQTFIALDTINFEREMSSIKILAGNYEKVKEWINNEKKIIKYFHSANKAKRAKFESNKNAELTSLLEVQKLGFADTVVLSRIDDLKNALAEERFSKYIRYTNELISNSNYKKASEELAKAEKLFPERQQLKELKSNISEKLKKIKVEEIIESAEKYASVDKWAVAIDYYSRAQGLIATSKKAKDGLLLSKTIIRYKSGLKDILDNPFRLKSLEVMEYAKKLLDNSMPYAQRSPSLMEIRLKVKDLVYKKMLPRSILIESDGIANIKVQGVGYIKPTMSKRISLAPGIYVFHAECRGHITNMLKVTVPIEDKVSPIRVFCGKQL